MPCIRAASPITSLRWVSSSRCWTSPEVRSYQAIRTLNVPPSICSAPTLLRFSLTTTIGNIAIAASSVSGFAPTHRHDQSRRCPYFPKGVMAPTPDGGTCASTSSHAEPEDAPDRRGRGHAGPRGDRGMGGDAANAPDPIPGGRAPAGALGVGGRGARAAQESRRGCAAGSGRGVSVRRAEPLAGNRADDPRRGAGGLGGAVLGADRSAARRAAGAVFALRGARAEPVRTRDVALRPPGPPPALRRRARRL